MKYLPRKYRESQTGWFGKRGITWHISVAFREVSSHLPEVHSRQLCGPRSHGGRYQTTQDRHARSEDSYSQDNAGCYHSGSTIVCANVVGKELGVAIKRLDFSDPQCGKGVSDRKAA